jgi:hypothetical protein
MRMRPGPSVPSSIVVRMMLSVPPVASLWAQQAGGKPGQLKRLRVGLRHDQGIVKISGNCGHLER